MGRWHDDSPTDEVRNDNLRKRADGAKVVLMKDDDIVESCGSLAVRLCK